MNGEGELAEMKIPFRDVGALMRDHAARHPNKTAIRDLDLERSLSYRELAGLVEDAAGRMAGLGVRSGDKVVILSDECVEKLVLLLATRRCGGVACPFHTEIAAGHLAEIVCRIEPALTLWRRDLDGSTLTAGVAGRVVPFDRYDATEPSSDDFFGLPVGARLPNRR